jgi:hypothetical protein
LYESCCTKETSSYLPSYTSIVIEEGAPDKLERGAGMLHEMIDGTSPRACGVVEEAAVAEYGAHEAGVGEGR